MLRIHAIHTGDVLVKTAFLGSPATAGGTMPYLAGVFMDRAYQRIPVMAWVIEHPEGIIVVDSGTKVGVKASFVTRAKYDLTSDQEIGAQLRKLGITPKDVAKVVMTHLHGDHMDGMADFEGVPIWIGQREFSPFLNSGFSLSKFGVNLPEWLKPNLITFRPERVGTFDASFPLTRDGKIVAVPTPGHTAGHLSVIVMDDDVHTFIAGDVTYDQASLLDQTLKGPSLEIAMHRDSLRRTLDYVRQTPTIFLPSHDPESATRLAEGQIAVPVATSMAGAF